MLRERPPITPAEDLPNYREMHFTTVKAQRDGDGDAARALMAGLQASETAKAGMLAGVLMAMRKRFQRKAGGK